MLSNDPLITQECEREGVTILIWMESPIYKIDPTVSFDINQIRMQHQMRTKTLLRSKLSKDKIQVH